MNARFKLRREVEIRIHPRNFAAPQAAKLGLDVPVKRSVDLDHVEKPRQIFQGVQFVASDFGRVKNPVPVFVRPAGSSNANLVGRLHRIRKTKTDSRLAQ